MVHTTSGGIRRRRRTAVATLGAATAVVVGLAGCGGGGGGSSTPAQESLRPTARAATAGVEDVAGAKASPQCAAQVKSLRMTVVGALNDVTKSGKAFMERAHPGLKVTISATAGNYDQVVTQISADKGAGVKTDVAVANLDKMPTFVNQLGAQELSPRLLRASYDQRFIPLGQLNGKQYGIPQQVSMPVIMYNKKVFAAAGVDPATLKDTDGVLAAAAKLKAKGGNVQPIDLPTGQDFGYWFLNTLANSKNANTQTSSGAPNFTSAPAKEAAQFLAKAGGYGPQSNDPTIDGLLRFGSGKTAMVGATVAAVGPTRRGVAGRGAQAFDIGVVPFPTLPGGTLRPVAGGNALVVLSADRCQREMATEFVVALLSPDVITASVQAVSYVPVDSAARTALAGYYQQNPDLKPLNDLVPNLVPPPAWGGTRGGEVPKTAATTVATVMKGKNPDTALADLQRQVESLVR